MRLFTVFRRSKSLAERNDIPLLDVSTKSGISFLTPDKGDIVLLETGKITDEEYVQRYRERLMKSYEANPKLWHDLARMKCLALMCERSGGLLANRFYVRDMLIAVCKDMNIEMEVLGRELLAMRNRGTVIVDDEASAA